MEYSGRINSDANSFEWTVPPATEQPSVSPHVNQFLIDYMHTLKQLQEAGIPNLIEAGMGDVDLVLSIVNDAYNQHRFNRHQALEKAAPKEMQDLVDELGGMPIDNS